MKAKIRKTGEIVDVICYGGSPNRRSDALDYVNYIDSRGVEHTESNNLNYYWDFEPIETTDEYWQEVRKRAAIAALQGLSANPDLVYDNGDEKVDIVARAMRYADKLVERLKKK
jgi:hypothetical protein